MANKMNDTEFSHESLNATIHERSRLGILTILATREGSVSFTDLMKLGGFSNGNLSRHISNLEKEGLVRVAKSFQDRRPKTEITLTREGRDLYFEYIDNLEKLILEAKALREKKPNVI